LLLVLALLLSIGCNPLSGGITGRLLEEESGEPVAGAVVVLCKLDKKECVLRTNLSTTTDQDGRFELTDVPVGSYSVLYSPGEVPAFVSSSWGDLRIAFENLDTLRETLGTARASRKSQMRITGEGTRFYAGRLYADQYMLVIEFEKGQPVRTQIGLGKTVNLEIMAWRPGP